MSTCSVTPSEMIVHFSFDRYLEVDAVTELYNHLLANKIEFTKFNTSKQTIFLIDQEQNLTFILLKYADNLVA